jgi:hypothetical protein
VSVEAERCLFIRLGKCREQTAQCIVAGELRLDYPQVSHEFCLDGRWTQVESQLAPQSNDREGSARHTNQIRAFYEASASTLWITFHADCVWWSFAAPGVSLRADGTPVGITFWGSATIAQRAAHDGLAQWLIDKAT